MGPTYKCCPALTERIRDRTSEGRTMSAEGDKLRGEQSGLRELAGELRSLLDATITVAEDQKAKANRWSGPQAERVRGELSVWKRKLVTMADGLDTAASQRGRDATAADAKPDK